MSLNAFLIQGIRRANVREDTQPHHSYFLVYAENETAALRSSSQKAEQQGIDVGNTSFSLLYTVPRRYFDELYSQRPLSTTDIVDLEQSVVDNFHAARSVTVLEVPSRNFQIEYPHANGTKRIVVSWMPGSLALSGDLGDIVIRDPAKLTTLKDALSWVANSYKLDLLYYSNLKLDQANTKTRRWLFERLETSLEEHISEAIKNGPRDNRTLARSAISDPIPEGSPGGPNIFNQYGVWLAYSALYERLNGLDVDDVATILLRSRIFRAHLCGCAQFKDQAEFDQFCNTYDLGVQSFHFFDYSKETIDRILVLKDASAAILQMPDIVFDKAPLKLVHSNRRGPQP